MKNLLLIATIASLMISNSGAEKKIGTAFRKKICRRSPSPCGGGYGIERISVVGQRPPSFGGRLPSWIFTRRGTHVGVGEGGGGGGSAPAPKPVIILLKLKEGEKGEKLVQDIIKEVEAVLGSTKGLLFKIALVESQFGNDPNTYRNGYNGGIFQVDVSGFQDTLKVSSHPKLPQRYASIQKAFGIDWTKVTWKDLRKPLYSAIAARLLLLNKDPPIPNSLRGQAKYWKEHYNSDHHNAKGTVPDFEKRWNAYTKSKQTSSGGSANQSGGRKGGSSTGGGRQRGGRPSWGGAYGRYHRFYNGRHGWHEP